ncbi:MAG: hypothetical protein PHX18_00735 [Candidatus Gastranaerophilales bacterium]|nr:hypothetical protein [Candidatus Gastranaerophilales bacterium]
MQTLCPFNSSDKSCNSSCALYIAPEELNELVLNKLASLGLMKRDEGICSYKHMALCMGRNIFESNHAKYGR